MAHERISPEELGAARLAVEPDIFDSLRGFWSRYLVSGVWIPGPATSFEADPDETLDEWVDRKFAGFDPKPWDELFETFLRYAAGLLAHIAASRRERAHAPLSLPDLEHTGSELVSVLAPSAARLCSPVSRHTGSELVSVLAPQDTGGENGAGVKKLGPGPWRDVLRASSEAVSSLPDFGLDEWTEHCLAGAIEKCVVRRLMPDTMRLAAETEHDGLPGSRRATPLGRNIDLLRNEAGWTYDDLAEVTGLKKSLVIRHTAEGKGAYISTVSKYAEAFTARLGRRITTNDLLSK